MFNSEIFIKEVKNYAIEIYEAFDKSENLKVRFQKYRQRYL